MVHLRTILPPALLGGAVAAQSIAGSFSPNPVAPGAPVTLTCTESLGTGCFLASPCTWYAIHVGSPSGPLVSSSSFCSPSLVPIGANGTFATTWDQRDGNGLLQPAGTYWFEVRTWNTGLTSLRFDWFPISIQSAPTPALTAAGPARLGQLTAMQIQAPNEPGAVFAAALAFTANSPISALGLQTNLDASLSFDFLVAPIGALDAAGNSSGLGLAVPNVPAALHRGAHVQALIFGAGGLQLTNSLAFTVVP